MENPTTVVALLMARLMTLARDEEGMSTVEYAIGLIAAAAFAGLLFVIVNAPAVVGALTALVQRSLTPAG
jgi:hypothetical protein